MEDTIRLDRKSFEALAAQSRVKVLKSLSARRKTLSELAKELGLSVSTMKEHLDVLCRAGLIVQKDEGRKWKYYELTRKGRGIVVPRELRVLIMLGISLLLVLGSGWNFIGAYSPYGAGAAISQDAPLPGGAQGGMEREFGVVPPGGESAGDGVEAREGEAPLYSVGEVGEAEEADAGQAFPGEPQAEQAYDATGSWASDAKAEGGEAASAMRMEFPLREALLFALSVLALAGVSVYALGRRTE
jgi:DNA-binding transcriptional ArsR family regulator